ncbi:MAG: Nif3-like dinuclear metal center hexameric protein [Clostridia bacterium]|jgi:hypothetical protein|nr:Nif3-like dinuclear metal center hexameric protein [Clostridia bacterium]
MDKKITAQDVLAVLDKMTGGRLTVSAEDIAGHNPFVVVKSSHIPGKAVAELPGLVYGRLDQKIKKIAVIMTLTESAIELAGATGVDAIIAHHPFADACNTGGVLLKDYLDLYHIAAFELHEAFHGLHPGIALLHGHTVYHADIRYGGIPGNVLYIGEALPEIKILGDMLSRLNTLLGQETEEKALEMDRRLRNCAAIEETTVAACGKILVGRPENPVKKILHIFPHTGFTPEHLAQALSEHPGLDTMLASISRVHPDHLLVEKAQAAGLNFICGNSHAVEIFENGLPLARALQLYLPGAEIVLFRERMSSIPLDAFGSREIRDYAGHIAEKYLYNK